MTAYELSREQLNALDMPGCKVSVEQRYESDQIVINVAFIGYSSINNSSFLNKDGAVDIMLHCAKMAQSVAMETAAQECVKYNPRMVLDKLIACGFLPHDTIKILNESTK